MGVIELSSALTVQGVRWAEWSKVGRGRITLVKEPESSKRGTGMCSSTSFRWSRIQIAAFEVSKVVFLLIERKGMDKEDGLFKQDKDRRFLLAQ